MSVIPSLDGPVLAALAATTESQPLSAVHRRAGSGSLSGVRKVLLRLIQAGLVEAVPGGYALNRNHIAAPAVEALASLHAELAARIRAALDAWQEPVLLAGLFGSAARRDGDASSDVDVLVITNEPAEDMVDELGDAIRRWTGNRAHIAALSDAELNRLRAARMRPPGCDTRRHSCWWPGWS